MSWKNSIDCSSDLYTLEYLADTDRSLDINSQEEVDKISRLVCESGDPMIQWLFAQAFIPQANRLDWYIPEPCGTYLQELAFRYKKSEMERAHVLGAVELHLPFYMNFKELAEKYLPDAEYVNSGNGRPEYILDNNGDIVFEITGTGNNISQIFSPLTLGELSALFLWLPSTHRRRLSALMGIPRSDGSDISEYIAKRWEFESAIPSPTGGIHHDENLYDPYCGVVRDSELHLSTTIKEAVQGQCSSDPSKVSFPAYGVTSTQNSEDPVLATIGLSACIGLTIYDPRSTLSLLGHFVTNGYSEDSLSFQTPSDVNCAYAHHPKDFKGDPPDTYTYKQVFGSAYDENSRNYCATQEFPLEWYVGTFKDLYFPGSSRGLMITVVRTFGTNRSAVAVMLESLKTFFPEATIRTLEPWDDSIYVINFRFDSRTGNITMEDLPCVGRWCTTPKPIPENNIEKTIIQL